MIDQGEAYLCPQLGAKVSEGGAIKLFAIVHRDFFWDTEATHDVLPEEFLQGSGRDVSECLGFDPLREVLYCDCCILEVSQSCWEGPTMSIPHRARGQTGGIRWTSSGGNLL